MFDILRNVFGIGLVIWGFFILLNMPSGKNAPVQHVVVNSALALGLVIVGLRLLGI